MDTDVSIFIFPLSSILNNHYAKYTHAVTHTHTIWFLCFLSTAHGHKTCP